MKTLKDYILENNNKLPKEYYYVEVSKIDGSNLKSLGFIVDEKEGEYVLGSLQEMKDIGYYWTGESGLEGAIDLCKRYEKKMGDEYNYTVKKGGEQSCWCYDTQLGYNPKR